jgi:hypothetical protein
MLEDLAFCQSVPLDGRGRPDAFGEEDLVEGLCHCGLEGRTGKVVKLGTGLSKLEPQRRGRSTQVELEGNPRMCPLVCPHFCLFDESFKSLSLRASYASHIKFRHAFCPFFGF